MQRLMRFIVRLGVLGGLAMALYKAVQSRRPNGSRELPWVNGVSRRPDLPTPAPPMPTAAAALATDAATTVTSNATRTLTKTSAPAKSAPAAGPDGATTPEAAVAEAAVAVPVEGQAWVESTGTVCPTSHPVKAKLASRLYHLPGMSAYARTKPDRCYPDETSAQADGLVKARR